MQSNEEIMNQFNEDFDNSEVYGVAFLNVSFDFSSPIIIALIKVKTEVKAVIQNFTGETPSTRKEVECSSQFFNEIMKKLIEESALTAQDHEDDMMLDGNLLHIIIKSQNNERNNFVMAGAETAPHSNIEKILLGIQEKFT